MQLILIFAAHPTNNLSYVEAGFVQKWKIFKTVKHSTPLRDGYQFYTRMTVLLELIFQIPAELFACISQSFVNILILGVLLETRDISCPRISIFCTYFKIEFLRLQFFFYFDEFYLKYENFLWRRVKLRLSEGRDFDCKVLSVRRCNGIR
jgi:hypothetical protein